MSIALLGVIFFNILFAQLDAGSEGGFSTSMIAFQLAFTKENALHVLGVWGVQGVAETADYLWLDYIYPVCYAFLLAASGSLIYTRIWPGAGIGYSYTLFVPIIAALLDWLENTIQYGIFASYPDISGAAVMSQSIVAAVKWGLALVSLAFVLFGVLYLALRAVRSPK
jgi:hypothetical protein